MLRYVIEDTEEKRTLSEEQVDIMFIVGLKDVNESKTQVTRGLVGNGNFKAISGQIGNMYRCILDEIKRVKKREGESKKDVAEMEQKAINALLGEIFPDQTENTKPKKNLERPN